MGQTDYKVVQMDYKVGQGLHSGAKRLHSGAKRLQSRAVQQAASPKDAVGGNLVLTLPCYCYFETNS